ncbi:MAG: diacylglycerol/lipid kinase family protein [Geminicoccaceae bacterium]
MERAEEPGPEVGVCVIVNTRSGRKRGQEVAEAIKVRLSASPEPFTVRLVRRGRDIRKQTERAVSEGYRTIVAAGGDGTISAVASGLVGTDRRLGVLPLGTFNFVARSLGIPETLEGAVSTLLDGHDRFFDVGDVNGRIFLNNASLGLYPAILQSRERIYRRWGRSRLAAHWSVLRTIVGFRSGLRLKVTVDGQTRRLRTPLVFIANNAYQLEMFGLDGADLIAGGKFGVFFAPDCGRLDLVTFAIRLARRQMVAERDFELLIGSDVLVETKRRRRMIALDGERERMTNPFHFRLRTGALRVVAPPLSP